MCYNSKGFYCHQICIFSLMLQDNSVFYFPTDLINTNQVIGKHPKYKDPFCLHNL